MSERKPGEHRWKLSWPGNFCLDCGLDDPLEGDDALVNCTCEAGCDTCSGTGCVINPNLVCPPCPFSTSSAPNADTEPES